MPGGIQPSAVGIQWKEIMFDLFFTTWIDLFFTAWILAFFLLVPLMR